MRTMTTTRTMTTMRATLFVAWMILLAPHTGAAQQPQPPQAPAGPVFVVSYVEVMPASARQAAELMTTHGDASRREDGNLALEILQRSERPSHFIVLEEWRDADARKAHRASAHTGQFHEKLTPLRVSPYDERAHSRFAVAPAGSLSGGTVLVVTHVDVVPAGVPRARELLTSQTETSRRQAGSLRFDVLQGVRQNHFTLIEAWRDERAYQANLTAAHTQALRAELQQLSPDAGLYDERLFRVLTR